MTLECHIYGCKYLQTTCLTCGRVVCTKTLPTMEWIEIKEKLKIFLKEKENLYWYGIDYENMCRLLDDFFLKE